MALRGSYGEGSQITGAMYQLSNQITLGLSEAEAIDNLNAITAQVIEQERRAREELGSNLVIQDKIQRAAGVLKSAKILSSGELMELLSYIRLGLSIGLLHGVTQEELNSLSVKAQPATLASGEQPLEQTRRDIVRAQLVRQVCAKLSDV